MSKSYDTIRERLLGKAQRDELFHAYILEGDETSAKAELARELAQEVLETKHPENAADYFCLKKSAMNIESVRKMISDSFVEPFKKKKFYLIEDASAMSVVMQNALLKTLEEPPSYAVFVLLCDNVSALLDTLRSRCVHYYLASKSEQEDFEARYDEASCQAVNEFYEASCRKDLPALMRVTDLFKTSKDRQTEILNLLLREAELLLQELAGRERAEQSILRRETVGDCREALTVFEVLRFIDIIESARKKIGSRCGAGAVFEVLLFDILEVLECQK